MKKASLILLAIISFKAMAIPHLDLDMTSDEYRKLLETKSGVLKNESPIDPRISYAISLGDRLSKWINLINETRSAEAAIRLTSATTRRSTPIEKPNTYSPEIIGKETQEIIDTLPQEMKEVLLSNNPLPSTTILDNEAFIKFARPLDRNYQSAARYKSVDEYRLEYIKAAAYDVRGYYYLTKNKITVESLKEISSIPEEKHEEIKEALIKICLNAEAETLESCQKMVVKAFETNTLANHYQQFFSIAQSNWDSFFIIPEYGTRRDIVWNEGMAVVPFNTPEIPKFIPYLQDNIEDEFKWGDWRLKVNFGIFEDGPRLIFEPGVVPHVNELGGNEIVMDSNQPIEEYESQWTIRHEFGHVLGLPDCYHEFYDVNLNAYVNYQLDVTDLMCSRAGNMTERIYNELKRVYNP